MVLKPNDTQHPSVKSTYSDIYRTRTASPSVTTSPLHGDRAILTGAGGGLGAKSTGAGTGAKIAHTHTPSATVIPSTQSGSHHTHGGGKYDTPVTKTTQKSSSLTTDKQPRGTLDHDDERPTVGSNRREVQHSRPNSGTNSKTVSQFVCPCCQEHNLQSREELLQHMRHCVTLSDAPPPSSSSSSSSLLDSTPTPTSATGGEATRGAARGHGSDTFAGHGHAKAVCPFCGKPSTKSALSAHLLNCQKRKASQERRTHPTKPLMSQSHKEKTPTFSSPTKTTPRKKTPLGNSSRSNVGSNSNRPLDDTDAQSAVSQSSQRSQSSLMSSSVLSQASTVKHNPALTYTSPMTQRTHSAIQASRQQQQQQQQRSHITTTTKTAGFSAKTTTFSTSQRGVSPYSKRGVGSAHRTTTPQKTGAHQQRPIIAAFR